MIPMTIFDANCLYVLKCLALVFVAAPCVLFAGGMLSAPAGGRATVKQKRNPSVNQSRRP